MRRALPSRSRTACLALLALVGSLLTTVIVATPALAEETYERPADGVFAIQGHGWGHGRGMSQWGAQGAASQGVDADTITATYYPGTTKAVLRDAPIRVLLQGDEGRDTQVYAASGLTVTDLATRSIVTLPSGPSRWRATVADDGLHLSSLTGSTWSAYSDTSTAGAPPPAYAGPLRFSGPPFVRVAFGDGTSRDYRGAVHAVQTSATRLQTLAVMGLEDYLLGVVPRESSSSWKPAALQAQSIAARSYSANKRSRVPSTATYDICDTTQCQVFGGSRVYRSDGSSIALEPASTTDAVRATAGVVRTFDGKPIFAEYSSSNGGWSTAGNVPYLIAQRDDWDGALANPVHSWKASLRASDLERRYPQIGSLRRLRITGRDGNGEWGGRVKKVTLEGVSSSGAATTVDVTGSGVYSARTWPASSDGLRSTWFRVTASTDSSVASASTPPRLVKAPGPSTGQLKVTVKNTGTTTWSTDGLHLAVASPPGEADALVGRSTRPGVLVRPTSGSIGTGQTADFTFALDAAGVQPGLHRRAYRLRNGTGALFGSTVSASVQVDAPSYRGELVGPPVPDRTATSPAPPDVFADGRTVVVPRSGSTLLHLQVRNTGNLSWPAAGPIVLGTSGPRERVSDSFGDGWVSPKRPARMLGEAAVAPRGVASFDLRLYGGTHPVGVTREAFEPAWEAKHWIDGAPVALTVVRTDPAVARLAGPELLPATAIRLAGTTTLVVRLRNLGGAAWPIGREWLAVGSGKPYRLRTSAWPQPTRPPALSANLTRPGTAAVYPGEVGEWRIPISAAGVAAGTYRESWQGIGPDRRRFGPVISVAVTVPSR